MSGNSTDTTQNSTTTQWGNNAGNNTSVVNPWGPQAGQITSAMTNADNLYNATGFQTPYSGNYVQTANPEQAAANTMAYNNATGAGQTAANGILSDTSGLASSGYSGANSALSGELALGGTNQAGANLATANQYANNPYIGQEVQAAMQSGIQTAADSTLPNIYRGAASGNNINSDRTALAQGQVEQGLAQTATNLSGQLQGQAWSQGLSAAQNGTAQQLQALSQAGSLGGSLGGAGIAGQTAGINAQGSVDNQAVTAGNNQNALDQLDLTNQYDQYQGTQAANTANQNALTNYYNAVAGRSFGSTTSGNNSNATTNNVIQGQAGTQTSDPSLLSTVGAGVGILGNLI